ncbi:MAG: Histone acetyltransferase type B subunit 2 [Watsoniomyces obsoletus]|nr:MAG: Histone acetyltransferase type B subunit 2 [Watsoniomyces obsoletus]
MACPLSFILNPEPMELDEEHPPQEVLPGTSLSPMELEETGSSPMNDRPPSDTTLDYGGTDTIMEEGSSDQHVQNPGGLHPLGSFIAYPGEPLTPETPSHQWHHAQLHGLQMPTPPSTDTTQHTGIQTNILDTPQRPTFDIFAALMGNADLMTHFICQLDIESFVSLYAISRDFHDEVDSHFASTITAHAEYNAPESARVFRFKAYKSLCRTDPVKRPHPVKADEVRHVPGFPWLRMVLYRERIVDEIIEALAAEAHRMPPHTSEAIKKVWLMMDVPLTKLRVGLFRNPNFWTERDLCLATLFFIKLDMRFIDPVDGRGVTKLRNLLMGQSSMTTLWRILKGTFNHRMQMMELEVRYSHRPSPQHRHLPILGIPPEQIGIGCRERAGDEDIHKRPLLVPPDELLMTEACRRGLKLEDEYVAMMAYGYFDVEAVMEGRFPEEEGNSEVKGEAKTSSKSTGKSSTATKTGMT